MPSAGGAFAGRTVRQFGGPGQFLLTIAQLRIFWNCEPNSQFLTIHHGEFTMSVIYKPDRSARLRKPASGSTVFDHAKTGNQLTKLKTAMDSVITTAADQTIGLNRTATPSIRGIAENRRIVAAAYAAANVLDALKLANDSAQSQDPDLAAYANELLHDKRFLALLSNSLSQISENISGIVQSRQQPANAAPVESNAAPNPEDEYGEAAEAARRKENGEPEQPLGVSKTRGGSGFPGTDAIDNSPNGQYGKAELIRDLEVERFIAAQAERKNPTVADAALSALQVIPAWQSLKWSASGRDAAREMAKCGNGRLAQLLADGGENVITGSSRFAFESPNTPIGRYLRDSE